MSTSAEIVHEVELDEVNHIYRVDGKITPSVTQILKQGQRDFYTPGSSERGHRVHVATILYELGDLEITDCPEYLKGYIEAWAAFLNDTGFRSVYRECIGCSDDGLYAGTIDRIGDIKDRRYTVDIKSGGKEKKHVQQLAAYYGLRGVAEDGSTYSGANETAVVYIKNNGAYSFDHIYSSYRMNAMVEFRSKLNQFYREAL